MRIYAHQWTLFPVMDAVAAARFAAANGFAGLELHCNPLDFWPGRVPASTLAELAAIGRGEGIEYALYGCGTVNAATALPELGTLADETLRRMLDLATGVGGRVLCLHSGTVDELDCLGRKGVAFSTARFDPETLRRDAWERARASFVRWAGMAEGSGVLLVVENDAHSPLTATPSAHSLADLVRAVDRPGVRVNFDTGHAHIAGGLTEELAALEPYVAHVHLDDNATTGLSEHLPLGEGAVDFAAIAGFLSTTESALSLEIYAPARPVEATLRSRAHLLAVAGGAR